MKFSFSLYFQITVLFLLLSIISAVGAGTLNYLESRRIIVEQFNESMRSIATTISSSLNDKADDAADAIMRLCRHDILHHGTQEDIQSFLKVAVDSSSLFNNIYYFDPTGPLKAAAYADGRDLSRYAGENFLTYREREKTRMVYFDLVRALETRTPVFSAFFKSATDRLMNSFIVPVVHEERVIGLMSCGIVLDRTNKLLDMMQRLKPHPQGYIALIDKGARILLNVGEMPDNFSPNSEWMNVEDLLISESGYLQTVLRMEKTGLGICVGIPETAIAGLLSHLRRGTIGFTLGAGLVATLFGILAASILISPLSELVKGLRQLRAGAHGDRIDRAASGEIAEAIVVYNEISDRLARNPENVSCWARIWDNEHSERADLVPQPEETSPRAD
ncbi:MAG TPA: cache domain-containing protein [Candidatus Rifleibacterium sp.]|nr:cache domain-containing protein [Candidatus Rifleibacterium sp.]HPT47196.1 cache domain-containing protein [Candidatus Rifleibacterium sp.]